MRFLHTADWHIGKKLHGFSLAKEQADAYRQIVELAVTEKVDAVVIAGDLYDRGLPSEESVKTVNEMLKDLNLTKQFPVLAISGNHDSSTRLSTGTEWFAATQFYLNTTLEQAMQPVAIGDTQFFLLPYFEPVQARQYFEDDDIRTAEEGMRRLIPKMVEKFDADKHHVLVAHFFAAGSSTSDSETKVTVGGLNAIPTDLLADFDYVALGHLHKHTALNEPKIKYSGSPVKFSTSEANDEKGVWLVDTDAETATYHPLTPLHDLVVLEDSFNNLVDPTVMPPTGVKDFVAVNLTDTKIIPNVVATLRQRFPRLIELNRINGRDNLTLTPEVDLTHEDLAEIMSHFFEEVTGHVMTSQQNDWAVTALKTATDESKEGDEA